ncbi:F-box/RNI-like/FBD-like superfamily protein-containing protein [Thalictrum thalictroides]|uniref:F-box/RNI-like/FBD-like superfamily protein-containing protein n=1 Tax=Thalictrum thalictroides TaxID=46969 RepID=A0A7J6W717_THATH|nr:F-box/RNI-like/FBD-like superfamily protein-containing protein [Thalictrum thalictroides]
MSEWSPTQKRRGRDRISNLPDDILQQVFSFLDMKQVMQTSLLSKRFKQYSWKSLHNLNFDYSLWKQTLPPSPEDPFSNFVDQVLRLRDDLAIGKFKLSVGRLHNLDTIQAWFNMVTNQCVREMDIFFHLTLSIVLNSSIFTSDHLQVFKLESDFQNIRVQLPESMCSASSLKTLKLVSVALPYVNTGELVLNYPMLENLFIKDCFQAHLKVFNICSPQLKNLVIDNSHNGLWNIANCKLKICDVKLIYFEYKGVLYEDCLLQNLNPLDNAALYLNPNVIRQADSVTKFIGGLCNVKMLTLEGLQIFPNSATTLQSLLTPLSKLRKLKLRASHDNASIYKIANILQGCPLLETFTWEVINVQVSGIKDNKAEFTLPPDHIWHHLKFVKILKLRGHKNEVEFLIFLLKNAMVLEEMYLDRHTYKTRSKQYIEKLLASVPISPSAKISFRPYTYINLPDF